MGGLVSAQYLEAGQIKKKDTYKIYEEQYDHMNVSDRSTIFYDQYFNY